MNYAIIEALRRERDEALEEKDAAWRAFNGRVEYSQRLEKELEALRRELERAERRIHELSMLYEATEREVDRLKEDQLRWQDISKTTVTREQIKEATDNTNMSGYKDTPSYSAMLEFCHHLGLIIQDSELKGDER